MIMDYETQRAERLKELEKLWKQKTNRSLKEFDEAIRQKFQTKDGRDALTFASMDIVENGLKESKDK